MTDESLIIAENLSVNIHRTKPIKVEATNSTSLQPQTVNYHHQIQIAYSEVKFNYILKIKEKHELFTKVHKLQECNNFSICFEDDLLKRNQKCPRCPFILNIINGILQVDQKVNLQEEQCLEICVYNIQHQSQQVPYSTLSLT